MQETSPTVVALVDQRDRGTDPYQTMLAATHAAQASSAEGTPREAVYEVCDTCFKCYVSWDRRLVS